MWSVLGTTSAAFAVLSLLLRPPSCRAGAEPAGFFSSSAAGGSMAWKYKEGDDQDWQKNANVSLDDGSWTSLPDSFELKGNDWYWFRGHLTTPDAILQCSGDGSSRVCQNVSTAGKCVGAWISIGSGGGVYVNGSIQARYSSDHPANVLLTRHAVPGGPLFAAVRVWTDRGGSNFSVGSGRPFFTMHNCTRATTPFAIDIDASTPSKVALPRPFSSISMPVDWPEYDNGYKDRMKAAGLKYVRIDHLLCNAHSLELYLEPVLPARRLMMALRCRASCLPPSLACHRCGWITS